MTQLMPIETHAGPEAPSRRKLSSTGLRILVAFSLLFEAVAATGAPPTVRLGPGEHRIEIEHDGRDRYAWVHVPPAGAELPPLLLDFHGGGGTPEGHRDHTRIAALADREGFVVVHPAGVAGVAGRLRTWNVGFCCGRAAKEDVDDVGFIRALLADLSHQLDFDPRRVYATGHSNGGMMTMRLAAEAPELLAAIAPVAGAAPPSRYGSSRAVPILHIHSADDPRALYAGGLEPPFPLTRHRVQHPSVEEVLAEWRGLAGCEAEAAVAESREGAGPSGDAQTATLLRYPCRSDATGVEHWRLTGVGHGWPGSPERRRGLIGEPTTLIDANEEVWRFVRRYTRPESPAD
jgi:polyhydroxybutyrate depolymerase